MGLRTKEARKKKRVRSVPRGPLHSATLAKGASSVNDPARLGQRRLVDVKTKVKHSRDTRKAFCSKTQKRLQCQVLGLEKAKSSDNVAADIMNEIARQRGGFGTKVAKKPGSDPSDTVNIRNASGLNSTQTGFSAPTFCPPSNLSIKNVSKPASKLVDDLFEALVDSSKESDSQAREKRRLAFESRFQDSSVKIGSNPFCALAEEDSDMEDGDKLSAPSLPYFAPQTLFIDKKTQNLFRNNPVFSGSSSKAPSDE